MHESPQKTSSKRPIYADSRKTSSRIQVYSNLSYLQSLGLVALVSTKLDRTYANRAVLTFDQGILSELCRLRFGE